MFFNVRYVNAHVCCSTFFCLLHHLWLALYFAVMFIFAIDRVGPVPPPPTGRIETLASSSSGSFLVASIGLRGFHFGNFENPAVMPLASFEVGQYALRAYLSFAFFALNGFASR